MKAIQTWLDEYGESHQNASNKTIHWICVPLIFFSVTGLLYCIKLPKKANGSGVVSLGEGLDPRLEYAGLRRGAR